MGELFFGSCVLILSISTFIQGFNWSGWNRGFLGVYGSVIEASVVNFDGSNSSHPYFDGALLETNLDLYMELNMKPYCVSCDCNVILSNPINEMDFQTARLEFSADLGLRKIQKRAVFNIVETEEEDSGDD